jgi:hypothetical protein
VWHASVAPMRLALGREALMSRAIRALDPVGDASLGEWHEWTGRAYHIRRRLSSIEELRVGPAVDVRGTPEARWRLARVAPYAPPGLVQEEV